MNAQSFDDEVNSIINEKFQFAEGIDGRYENDCKEVFKLTWQKIPFEDQKVILQNLDSVLIYPFKRINNILPLSEITLVDFTNKCIIQYYPFPACYCIESNIFLMAWGLAHVLRNNPVESNKIFQEYGKEKENDFINKAHQDVLKKIKTEWNINVAAQDEVSFSNYLPYYIYCSTSSKRNND